MSRGYNKLADTLRRKKKGVRQRKKKPSGHGDGKWENVSSLASYRRKRNRARKAARASRRVNRAA